MLAVADTRSFTEAAGLLHIAQSSLSRAVADTERRVGARIFVRTTRSVALTPEGHEFVTVARRVLSSFDAGMNHFAGFLDGTRGSVRLATLPSLAATLLPPVVATYRATHPEVEVHIVDGLLEEVLGHVQAGDVDFAVTVRGEEREGLTFRQTASDEFFAVFPPGHAFGEGASVPWSALEGQPFIAFDETSSVRRYVDRALHVASVRTGARTEARNVAAVGGLVSAGLGVSAVPALVLPLLQFAGLQHRPLTGPRVQRPIGVVLDPARPQAPAAATFLDAILRPVAGWPQLPTGTEWCGPPCATPDMAQEAQ